MRFERADFIKGHWIMDISYIGNLITLKRAGGEPETWEVLCGGESNFDTDDLDMFQDWFEELLIEYIKDASEKQKST